ncbi:hypothetical protein M2145_002554 [Lachnospiraceae bacterium PF1-21]
MQWILDLLGGPALYKAGCEIWNAFMDVTLAFLLKTPQDVDASMWSTVVNNIYPVFLALSVSLVTVFFFAGLYRDVTDFRQITGLENMIFILVRLAGCNAAVLLLWPFISGAFQSGAALSKLIIDQLGFTPGSGYGHIEATSIYLSNPQSTLGIGAYLFGSVFMLACLVCGGIVAFSVFSRLWKMIMAVPTGGLAVGTIAGGGQISAVASSWLKEFLMVIMEASFMVLAIGLAVPFMGVPLIPTSSNTGALMSIIEPIFKIVLLTGAITGTSKIVRKYLGLH